MAETVEKTPMQRASNVLAKLWPKTQDGTASELEQEAFEALRLMHDEMQRIESRIRHAKDKMTGAAAWLDGEWG